MQQDKVKKMMTYRWVVWGVLVLSYIIVFFHRLSIGVVRQELVDTFNITGTTFANIGSTYFYAYMVMQIPSGILADSLGARKTVTIGTLMAGIGSIIFGLAPNLMMVFIGRLIVGIGVSVVFIAILKTQSQWFREREFATMTGLTSLFGNLGGMMAQTPLVFMVAYFTWRTTFVIIGVISLVVGGLSYVFVRNSPKEMGLPTIQEIEGIQTEATKTKSPSLMEGLSKTLSNWRTWPGFFLFIGFYGPFVALSGTWGQSYLMQVYGLAPEVAPNYLLVSVLGLAIGSIVIGKISDSIRSRKLPMILAGAVYVISWALVVLWNGGKPPLEVLYPLYFVLGFTCSIFLLGLACAKEVNHPSIAGISTSVVNIGGFLGAAIIPPILGRVFDTYGGILEPVVLYQKAFMYCLVAAVISFMFTFLIKETNCKNIYGQKE